MKETNTDIEYDYSNEEADQLEQDEETISEVKYLDDDEAFLAGDDVLLSQTDVLSIFQQSDNLVSYEIINFYDEKGKVRNKLSLLNDPPILHITSSKQDSVDFVLTKELVENMAFLFKDVDRAYNGISPKKDKPLTQDGIRSRFDNFVEWVKENKLKAGMLGVLIVLFVIYSVLSFS